MICLTLKSDAKCIIIPIFSWGTQPIYESFIPTEVDGGNRLNDIIEVNVDLNKLSRFCGNFDISDIQKEVCIQMRVEGTMVMLHKSETPVKDTPNTRGKRYLIWLLKLGPVFLRNIFVGYILWILHLLR